MSEPGDEMGNDESSDESSNEMGSADMSGAEMDCAGLAEVAAELALGVLTGRERAQAIAHLDRCDACREDVRQLMATSEGLLTLLSAAEPPAGFETRVLDRLGLPAAAGREDARAARYRHARPRRAPGARGARGARRLVASAAVALAVIGAGAAGWGISTATAPRQNSPITAQPPLTSAALFTPSHQNVGQVFVYQGSQDQNGQDQSVQDQGDQQWMYMSVDLSSGNGTVTCQVVAADGKMTTVGSFRLADGYGAWASALPWSGGTVHAARLLAADGTVLATATFGQSYTR
jgi:hypothetical protein